MFTPSISCLKFSTGFNVPTFNCLLLLTLGTGTDISVIRIDETTLRTVVGVDATWRESLLTLESVSECPLALIKRKMVSFYFNKSSYDKNSIKKLTVYH